VQSLKTRARRILLPEEQAGVNVLVSLPGGILEEDSLFYRLGWVPISIGMFGSIEHLGDRSAL
jgi:hypothetical protein